MTLLHVHHSREQRWDDTMVNRDRPDKSSILFFRVALTEKEVNLGVTFLSFAVH
jgi:hypothetical protein